MKKLLLSTLAALSSLPLSSMVQAQDKPAAATPAPAPAAAPEALTANQIIERVRYSRALGESKNPVVFPGTLTRGGTSVPFEIRISPEFVQFNFENPKQTLRLETTDKSYRLKEVLAGATKDVPPAMYGTGVRGTDLTYDDVSMRYLYWPTKKLIAEESIKTRKCYVVDLYNPQQKVGEYYMVRVFVDKESGGLMRMMGFDWNGKLIKSCTVTAGMKVNGATVLKNMEVIRYVPGTTKAAGETTFELKKP